MYMVIFTSAEGRAGYHHAEELDEAVKFVERMRNGEGVTDARVFRMTEIPLEVRTYYKVELASSSTVNAQSQSQTGAPATNPLAVGH